MPIRPDPPQLDVPLLTALARAELEGPERDRAEQLVAMSGAARAYFRSQTAARWPRIRNYTLLGEVGRGGFGVVYRAVHHSKLRIEAVKVLFGTTAQREAYFENEVRLVAGLRHPNIATLYEARLVAPPLYYSMEYVAGEQLDKYVQRHRPTLERRIELVRIVVEAMAYAHRAGVVHRDLKPQNILIDRDGQPRIVDFGIARRILGAADAEKAAAREAALGTFGYMAPEQMAGQAVDGRADIYSLGALLFHVISGQPARLAPEADYLTTMLRARDVNRAEDLAAIIARCVASDPAARYRSCAALAEDLRDYLEGRPVHARPSRWSYRAGRLSSLIVRRHLLPVQLAATTLVIVFLSGLFWFGHAHWVADAPAGDPVQLIALRPSTIEAFRAGRLVPAAPLANRADPKSLRVLAGALMERLAVARPKVLVWDFTLPDCHPQYDAAFIAGVRALGAPVVIGFRELHVNAEPVVCGEIRTVVAAAGSLISTAPVTFADSVLLPLAVQRGQDRPWPSLAVAGLAAARHPQAAAELRIVGQEVQMLYRRRDPAPHEARWLDDQDRLPFYSVSSPRPGHPGFMPEDRLLLARFPLTGVLEWANRAIAMEEVFTAEDATLRQWFGGRVVLVGPMLPYEDTHPLAGGEYVFGCQVQAAVLTGLLAGQGIHRLPRAAIVLRVLLWAVLGTLVVYGLPLGRPHGLRRIAVALGATIAMVAVMGLGTTHHLSTAWRMELTIGLCAFFTAGAVAGLLRLLHARERSLAPSPTWSPDEHATASTTVLAATRAS